MKKTMKVLIVLGTISLTVAISSMSGRAQSEDGAKERSGKRLFKRETFVGNGRTCTTCTMRADGLIFCY